MHSLLYIWGGLYSMHYIYIAPEAYILYVHTHLLTCGCLFLSCQFHACATHWLCSATGTKPHIMYKLIAHGAHSHWYTINSLHAAAAVHTSTYTNMCAHARTWLNLLGLDINCLWLLQLAHTPIPLKAHLHKGVFFVYYQTFSPVGKRDCALACMYVLQ